MRTPVFGDGIRARAIAGTYTVLFAFDADEPSREGLLGFAIRREDPAENQAYWLKGLKVFPSVVPNPKKGVRYTTLEQPIQSFLWGDYTAKPGRKYIYTIRPVYGAPKNLTYGEDVVIELNTEPERADGEKHGVWFNRGAIASQFYADTFENAPPPEPDNPDDKQTKWLSRGLLEACLEFINETPKGDALRVAAYEFTYPPILNALKAAIKRGVDVMIVYEAGKSKVEGVLRETHATKDNKKAIKEAGLPEKNLIKRTKRKKHPAQQIHRAARKQNGSRRCLDRFDEFYARPDFWGRPMSATASTTRTLRRCISNTGKRSRTIRSRRTLWSGSTR